MKKTLTFITKHCKISLLVVLLALVANLTYAQTKFVAYGDTRGDRTTAQNIIGRIAVEQPDFVIHSGDLWDGYGGDEIQKWVDDVMTNAYCASLQSQQRFLVARGNHETTSEMNSMSYGGQPASFILNGQFKYSFTVGNVFVVCSEMSLDATYLEQEMSSPAAQAADWRIAFHHYPVYSTGNYSYSGNSAWEAVCDQYDVAMTFCGHDHNYHRTKTMYGGSAVYSGTDVPANIQGTTYVVTGGGGAPLYSASTASFTDNVINANHYCVLNAYSDRIEMVVKSPTGTVLETFVKRKDPGIEHQLTVNSSSNGTIDPPTGLYPQGDITVTATANTGYAFDYWTGDLSGSVNPTTLTLDAPKTIGAVYRVVPTYNLTTSAVNGSVSPASGTYSEGTTVSLTATPDAGYEFTNWSGDASGTANPIDVVMTSNKNVVANFALIPPSFGYPVLGESNTTTATRRCMPLVMPEDGEISSISMYHLGGTGNMILGVYDGTATAPGNLIGVTPTTAVSATTGWQKINLITPVQVAANQNVHLAWVYETNPGIQYTAGSPGRIDGGTTWTGGMPDPWGSTATQSAYLYNIVAYYTPGGGNEAPIANANGPYTGEAGTAVSMSSAGSSDPDGTIASYAWDFGDGGTSTQANPSHTYTSGGTYTVSLVVTDNGGKPSVASTTTATISDVPQAPIAEANGPYTGQVNTAISFSSAGSNDPDGSIASYAWNFGDGGTSTQANPSHTYTSVGSYTATLTVADNDGMTGTDQANVTVSDVPQYTLTDVVNGMGNIVLNPAGNTYAEGTVVSATAAADPGWEFTGWSGAATGTTNPVSIAMDANKTLTATFVDGSAVVEEFGILDLKNTTTTSANRRAMPVVVPKSGTITSLSMRHVGGSGSMILGVYEGTATAPGNRIGVTATTTVSSVDGWQEIVLETPVHVDAGQNVFLAWVYETNPGIYYDAGDPGRVDAGVAWSGGMPTTWGSTATQTSYLYNIKAIYTLDAAEPQAPVAEANGPYSGVIDVAVDFSSAGSNDPDGSIASYAWNFGDGGTSTQANPSHVYTSVGTYTATLTVTDNDGMTGTDQADITVTDGSVVAEEFGILDDKTTTTTSANRRAMPVVVPKSGTVTSMSMRHVGGSGSMILGIYDGSATVPGNLIGVTATTAVSGTDGWQEIALETPVHVDAGQNVFLAWVYETNPGIYYDAGDPGRVDAGIAWSGGMPSSWGSTATQSSWLYNIKAIYTPDAQAAPAAPVAQENNPQEIMDEDASFYPNPSNGMVYVNIPGEVGSDAKIQLFNLAGMLIKNVKAEQGTQEIDLGDVPAGVYIISLPANGKRVNKRLIIQE